MKDNVLYTPSLKTGILNGITRAFIIKVAEELRIEIKEGFFTKDELLSADEAFVTNSIQEIVPLYHIEGRDFPGKVGMITKGLCIFMKCRERNCGVEMNCEEEMCNLKWDYDLRCGEYTLNLNEKTLIMGILNVTPDSFSDGGSYNEVDAAVRHAKEMKDEGAHIIDIGGESTRPGFAKVSVEEEIKRVVPMIQTVSKEVELPISIDTYKAEVAKQAIEAGAHIINDIWGRRRNRKLLKLQLIMMYLSS